MNELTPSTKSRGNNEKRTSERKDTEELNRAKRRHFWQVHPPCRFQEDQSAQGPTGATQRYRRRREQTEKTRLSAKSWAEEKREKKKEWLAQKESQREGEQR